MVLECPGLENMKEKPEALAMARCQLNDFEYDYPLSLDYFGQNMKLDELVLPPGEEGVTSQTLVMFSYLLQRNEANQSEWLIQPLSGHKAMASSEVASFYSSTLVDFMSDDQPTQNTNQSKSIIQQEDSSKFNNDIFESSRNY